MVSKMGIESDHETMHHCTNGFSTIAYNYDAVDFGLNQLGHNLYISLTTCESSNSI